MLRALARAFGPWTKTDRRTNQSRPRLAVESLEDRSVPATLQVLGGVLTYTAGSGVANNLKVMPGVVGPTFQDTSETITVLGLPGAFGSGTNTVTVYAFQVPAAGMRINLGDKADRFAVEATEVPIAVKGGDGSDVVDVGLYNGGGLGGILAPITVDGEAGADTVRLNDPASTAGRNYTVTATQVLVGLPGQGGAFNVNYGTVENLAVNAGSGWDRFFVRGTAAGTRTTLNANLGEDQFDVGSVGNPASTLDDIKGPLTLDGGSGLSNNDFGDTAYLHDEGSSARSYTLRADSSLARSGGGLITYNGLYEMWLYAGAFDDTVAVAGTPANTRVTLNLGAGNDRVTVGNNNSLDSLQAPLEVIGMQGTDSVTLNDQNDGDANTYFVVNGGVYYRAGTYLHVRYSFVENVTVNAGNSDDHFSVQSTTTPVTLRMGGGNDVAEVGSSTYTLDTIQAGVTVEGQGGADELRLFDYGSLAQIPSADGSGLIPVDYTVTATAVARTQAAPVAYATLETLNVYVAATPIISLAPSLAGDANDVRVKGTSAATTIRIGSYGTYTVTVGSDAQSLDSIQGALTTRDQGGLVSLVLNDQGDANANSYTVTSRQVTRPGMAPVSYYLPHAFNRADVVLNAGAFGDTVSVPSFLEVPFTVYLGGGNDTATLGMVAAGAPHGAIYYPVSVHGQAGIDTITVNDPATVGMYYTIGWTYVTRNNPTVLHYDTAESLTLNAGTGADVITLTSTRPETPVVVRAGLGDDVFQMASFGTLTGAVTLDGQGGADTLDYSAYGMMGVRVNLALGTATEVTTVSNLENVNGSQGNDILVGNNLGNTFRGGSGRDILIGRGGADWLFGEGGDDILIGGSTVHDLTPARLEDLMREWGRTDLYTSLFMNQQMEYLQRIDHLRGVTPGGLNGTTLLSLSQVIDDGAADTLSGDSGYDWFFLQGADVLFGGLEPWERVN